MISFTEEDDERMTWDEAYEQFDAEVNEFEPPVKIMGCYYDPARALLEIDPIAYNQEFLAWADARDIDTDSLIGPDQR